MQSLLSPLILLKVHLEHVGEGRFTASIRELCTCDEYISMKTLGEHIGREYSVVHGVQRVQEHWGTQRTVENSEYSVVHGVQRVQEH